MPPKKKQESKSDHLIIKFEDEQKRDECKRDEKDVLIPLINKIFIKKSYDIYPDYYLVDKNNLIIKLHRIEFSINNMNNGDANKFILVVRVYIDKKLNNLTRGVLNFNSYYNVIEQFVKEKIKFHLDYKNYKICEKCYCVCCHCSNLDEHHSDKKLVDKFNGLTIKIDKCSICLEEVDENTGCYLSKCSKKHYFHLECISKISKRECPICREHSNTVYYRDGNWTFKTIEEQCRDDCTHLSECEDIDLFNGDDEDY